MDSSSNKYNIDRVTSALFFEQYYCKSIPAILTDVVPKWCAYQCWTTDYFENILKEKQIDVAVAEKKTFLYKDDKAQYKIKKMPFNQTIKKIQSLENNRSFYYIMQRSMPDEFPELMPDIEMPFWLDKNQITTNFWFGSEGNFTQLHYDLSDNYLAQVFGSKHFTLYDTTQIQLLYPNPVVDNYSHVSRVDITSPNFSVYPEFKKAKAIEFTLQAGEMLYLPSHWWHAVSSLSVNAMVNFWSTGNNLDVYLNDPTGIRSLWILYKEDLLQSLKDLIKKNGMSFLGCAEQVLPINPSASILFAHAEIIDFILMLDVNKRYANKNITQLNDHINYLLNVGLFSNNDIENLKKWRLIALQTFTDYSLTIEQARTTIAEIKNYISGFMNE